MGEQGRASGRRPRRTEEPVVVADLLLRLAGARRADRLRTLTSIALEVTDADRATFHVLEGDGLRPAVAIGRDGEPAAPIGVGNGRAAALLANARASVDILASESLVLVPVVTAGEPVGVLALDWRDGEFDREDLRLLEAVAAYAGACGTEVDATRERLALDLAAADTVHEVAVAAERWCREALGPDVVAVALLDRSGRAVVRTDGAMPMAEALAASFDGVFGGSSVDAPGLLADLVAADGLRRCFAVHLTDRAGRLVGGLVVGTGERDGLGLDERADLDAAGAVLGAALGRVRAQADRFHDGLRSVAEHLLGAVSLLADLGEPGPR